jgi:hypothetical protein
VLYRLFELAWVKQLHISYLLGIFGGRFEQLQYSDYKFCASDRAQLPTLLLSLDLTDEFITDRLSGSISALGFEWRWSGDDIDWHRSPDTGRSWPRLFFGRIDYRQGNPHGDVRVAWEPSRLQQLVELAIIARDVPASREQAIKLLENQLESWMRANPPGCGIHYISVMECGLRLIAVCHALDIARPHLDDESPVWRSVTTIVASHAYLIRKRLSLYSSSGNHTIAECTGLVYAGVLFPEMKGADDWLETGVNILCEESGRQILADGGGIERSLWYHLFVLDLLGLVGELLRHRGDAVPVEISTAVQRGCGFIALLANSQLDLPKQGDWDDGYALSPHLQLTWRRSVERIPVETFIDYGLTSITIDQYGSSRLLFDHGSLGMAPSYGHGHADALSLLMDINGKELLIDTGTFSYTGDPKWRGYFRSTPAHNTVCVDGHDQAQQATAFQWSRPYSAELVRSHVTEDGTIYLQARHNGYADICVEHVRYIIGIPGRLVIVLDQINGEGEHKLDLYWHLATDPVVENGILRFDGYDQNVLMSLQDSDFLLCRGEQNPICGWRSPCYGIREPITTVMKSYVGKLPHEFVTMVKFDGDNINDEALESYLDKARSWVFNS